MKKSNLIITIPKPCSENWSTMTPIEQGRFCQFCQKKVFDFTQSSDYEIAKAYYNNDSLCGRFVNTQLNRKLVVPKEKNSIWMATISAVISFLGIGVDEIKAQEKPMAEQTEKVILKGKPFVETKNDTLVTISGIVSDHAGTLPGTNVSIKNSSISVHCDMDGKYSIEAKEGDVLVYSFLGMITKEEIVFKSCNLDVNLEIDPNIREQIVMVGGISVKRRTFAGRIFHSIGNLFR